MDKDIENKIEGQKSQNDGQATIEEEKVDKKAFEGIRAELIQTRQEKNLYASQLSEVNQKMQEMQARLQELEAKKEEQALNSLFGEDEEAPITKAEIKQAYKKLQELQQQQTQMQKRQAKLENFNQSINRMRQETQDKAKYGLDWDNVFPVIQKIYAANKMSNEAWEEYLLNTAHPAKELYEMALKDPIIQEKVKLIENEKVLNTMENRKVDKTVMEGSTSSPKPPKALTAAEIARMTPAEAAKRMKEVDEFLKSNLARSKK